MAPTLRLGLLSSIFVAVALAMIAMERWAATRQTCRGAGFAVRTLAAACPATGLALAARAAIAGGWITP